MIADVVFDLPRRAAFTYRLPPGPPVRPGQRVTAPLQGRTRVGVVVDVRPGDGPGLRAIERPVESVPIFSAAGLALARWAADEGLSSLGSTLFALSPPPPRPGPPEALAPAPEAPAAEGPAPELWLGRGRARRLADHLTRELGPALLIAPDVGAAARWAERLEAARLDSGAPESERRAAWFAGARGRARVVVGTRSALLAPLPPPATLVLLDEHDPAHKPPGAPRLHSRDVLLRRAALEGSRLILVSATPSVESWSRSEGRRVLCEAGDAGPWPEIVTADTRQVLRTHPLTPPLARAVEETTRSGSSAALIVTHGAAGLACDDCGAPVRCPDCALALGFARATRTLACRLCGTSAPAPDACPACRGHRLTPFGWGSERVEASVRTRFPRLTVSRAHQNAQVVIGTTALLRRLQAGAVGCIGFVTLDALLRLPDFRAGERAFQLLWAAAETVAPGGRVVAQTRYPEHYAIRAVKARDPDAFYAEELRFREELGYPPFRRLCVVSVTGRSAAGGRALIAECAARLGSAPGLTLYPPVALGPPRSKRPRWRFVIKGPADLPSRVGPALGPVLERRRQPGGMVEVEMDPVEFP